MKYFFCRVGAGKAKNLDLRAKLDAKLTNSERRSKQYQQKEFLCITNKILLIFVRLVNLVNKFFPKWIISHRDRNSSVPFSGFCPKWSSSPPTKIQVRNCQVKNAWIYSLIKIKLKIWILTKEYEYVWMTLIFI